MAANLFASLLAASLLVSLSSGKKPPLFDKDHRMDTVFPPVGWHHPELPAGHLQALGHQRPPEGPLPVAKGHLSPTEFLTEFVQRNQPIVARDAVSRDSPAMAAWTDSRLRLRFGHLRVTVTHKRETLRDPTVKVLRLDEFLDRYRQEDLYLASLVPEEMDDGFWLPQFASCGPVRRGATEAEIWLSAGGTGSLLHFHRRHQLHCILDGRKDYILIEPHFKESLRCEEEPAGSGSGRSQLDVDMINGFTDPQVARTPWRYATLLPGDCVFVPQGHLHQVRGYGRAFSFALVFGVDAAEQSLSDCQQVRQGASLSELPLVWTFGADGFSRLRDRKLTPEALRRLLLAEAADTKHLSFASFANFYAKATAAAAAAAGTQPNVLSAKSAFRIIARSDKKQIIPAASIVKLPAAELSKISRFLNSIHRPVRDEL